MPEGVDLRHQQVTQPQTKAAECYHWPGPEPVGKPSHGDRQHAAQDRGNRVGTRYHRPGPPELFHQGVEEDAEDNIQPPRQHHDDKGCHDDDIAIEKPWCRIEGLFCLLAGHD